MPWDLLEISVALLWNLKKEKNKTTGSQIVIKASSYTCWFIYQVVNVLVMIVLSLLIFKTDFFSFFLVVLQLQVPSRDFQKHCHVMNLQTQWTTFLHDGFFSFTFGHVKSQEARETHNSHTGVEVTRGSAEEAVNI